VVRLTSKRVVEELDHVVWAMDQPTMDGLNSYWISKLAAEAGYKVALSGQGGDELFGGYSSLVWFERCATIARWTSPLPSMPFSALFDLQRLPFSWRKLSYLFGCHNPFVASQLAVKVLFLDSDLPRYLVSPLGRNGRPNEAERHLSGWAQKIDESKLLEGLAFMDIHTHLEPRLLRDMDAMSMAHSIEVRPVFVDYRLVEFLLAVPASQRMQQKRLLLDATRRFLPGNLLVDLECRSKRTFTFPFARWLPGDLRPTLDRVFAPERLRATGVLEPPVVNALWKRYQHSSNSVGWSRIWSLFVLQRWCETMQVTT
jgi:asparagine synthase (glutamine-hydrolysing)